MTLALEIHGLRKTYANGLEALKGIDLEVREGDFYALLGPNGAGKSTTISILSSLTTPTAGEIHIFGLDTATHFSRAKRLLGVVGQEVNFNQFEKVWDEVRFQAGYYGLPPKIANERAEQYLTQLGIWDKRMEQGRALSGGMKRRVMIAKALIHRPRLLILDEPTAGVDIELRRAMWDFLREINADGTTIILTTHYLEEAENLCRYIAIIDRGNIVQDGPTRELLRQLDMESFVLDLEQPLSAPPRVPGYHLMLIDKCSLQVDVPRGSNLNDVFSVLSDKDIKVVSMRTKANRLEEIFMRLVESSKEASGAATSGETTSGETTSGEATSGKGQPLREASR